MRCDMSNSRWQCMKRLAPQPQVRTNHITSTGCHSKSGEKSREGRRRHGRQPSLCSESSEREITVTDQPEKEVWCVAGGPRAAKPETSDKAPDPNQHPGVPSRCLSSSVGHGDENGGERGPGYASGKKVSRWSDTRGLDGCERAGMGSTTSDQPLNAIVIAGPTIFIRICGLARRRHVRRRPTAVFSVTNNTRSGVLSSSSPLLSEGGAVRDGRCSIGRCAALT